jgi:hypothetical protein
MFKSAKRRKSSANLLKLMTIEPELALRFVFEICCLHIENKRGNSIYWLPDPFPERKIFHWFLY